MEGECLAGVLLIGGGQERDNVLDPRFLTAFLIAGEALLSTVIRDPLCAWR